LRPLAQALGLTIDELYESPLGRGDMQVDPGDPYAPLRRNVGILRACLDAAPSGDVPLGVPAPLQVDELCARVARKPNMVLAGHFDAGKSRLCNAMLGDDILPNRYQPTTAAGTWLIHVEDRPEWLDQVVYVYGRGFDPSRMSDQTYAAEHRVASGGLEILAAYAAHPPGRRSDQDLTLVAYLESPLLRGCNLLDVPGNQNSESDTRAAGAALAHADILVYVSRATGFLDETDVVQLRALLRQLPLLEAHGVRPLENLFVVASHAHPGIKGPQLDGLCADGAATILRELGDTVFAERGAKSGVKIELADVSRRVFPFWFETPDRREPLRRALVDALGVELPRAWIVGAHNEVEAFRTQARKAYDTQIRQYHQVLADVEASAREFEARRVREDGRRAERAAFRASLVETIGGLHLKHQALLTTTYNAMINESAIEEFVRGRYSNRKDAEKHAAGAVIDMLQSTVATEGAALAHELAPMVAAFLGQYSRLEDGVRRPDGSPSVDIEFDARGAFLGGMAGVGTIGALGAWAATLGNLGGYIIVAKVAGLLAALGIEVGGSAALVSLVAVLGGPVVVGVAIAAIFALGVGWLFGESWQTRLARKLLKTLEKNDVRSAFKQSIDDYWTGTRSAFERAADAVERQYQRHLEELGRVIGQTTSSPDELKRMVASLERLRDFFAGLPWKVDL
jgi:hypothetical protein